MREYKENPVYIDGRNIPYPVFSAFEYFELHDLVKDIESFMEKNQEIFTLVNQIIAIKQSCFLLMNVTHSCQSLCDDLHKLKNRLMTELEVKYNYTFDEVWMESII